MRIRKFLMRASWYVSEFADWVYLKASGMGLYISPHHCPHCQKWNFEEVKK